MKRLSAALLATALAACGSEDQENTKGYDEALLAKYKAALPLSGELEAPLPEPSAPGRATGRSAVYPAQTVPIAIGVNGTVKLITDLLKAVTSLPPTVYDSVKQEFVWGPFPGDDAPGYVAVWIKDEPEGADFDFSYVFARGIGNDLAQLTPVLWGGATPLPGERGVGVTLWDFEADNAFRAAHDQAFDPSTVSHGRFVTLYGRGNDPEKPANMFTFNVAVFRDFVPEDKPGDAPVDLDYYYGSYVTPEHKVDFLDFRSAFDVSDPHDAVAEDVRMRLAFLDEGAGRAEASASGGSMPQGDRLDVVECWDNALDQQYIHGDALVGGVSSPAFDDGNLADCGLIFAQTLDALQIPSLDAVDADLMATLDQVASTGLPPSAGEP